MPDKATVIENLDRHTGRLSDRVWSVSVGVIAVSMTYVVESAANREPFLTPAEVAPAAGLALLALLADLLQYLAAIRQNLGLLRTMEREGRAEMTFDTRAAAYQLRSAAYWSKLALCVAATAWIVAVSAARVVELMEANP
ncbi:MAG: hypothetical protein R6V44_04750 [Paracoccaceae bacterium]